MSEATDYEDENGRTRQRLLDEGGYLCGECAVEIGLKWPTCHAATCHMGPCFVCGEERSLSCWNDWIYPNETELKEWD